MSKRRVLRCNELSRFGQHVHRHTVHVAHTNNRYYTGYSTHRIGKAVLDHEHEGHLVYARKPQRAYVHTAHAAYSAHTRARTHTRVRRLACRASCVLLLLAGTVKRQILEIRTPSLKAAGGVCAGVIRLLVHVSNLLADNRSRMLGAICELWVAPWVRQY